MERNGATITAMSAWSEQLVTRFAHQLRKRRAELKLSAQDVADRTEELGHPVSRTAIADFELGRRKDRLMLGDALILAEALRMPLALLLYPDQPDGEVDLLPGVPATCLHAAEILSGAVLPDMPGDFIDTARGHSTGSQRINEYVDGSDLLIQSRRLESFRDSLVLEQSNYDAAMEGGNIEQAKRHHFLVEDLERRIAQLAERIRQLGGTVDETRAGRQ